MNTTGAGARRAALVWFGVVLSLAVWAYRDVPRLGFSDIDGATLLCVTRLSPEHSLAQILTQEFRGNPLPREGFYRPLTSLSYTLQQSIWPGRLWPLHAFDLMLHLACALALAALVHSLTRSLLASVFASLLFALHPVAAEVVPYLARRGESLALLLLSLAFWGERSGRRGLTWLCGCLAPLAKESGYLILLLPLAGADAPLRARLRRALFCALPALLLRLWVLGGVGGYSEYPSLVVPALARAWVDLLDPSRLLGVFGARALGVAVLAASAWLWREPALRLGLVWCVVVLAMAALAGGLAPWYPYAAMAGLALTLATWMGSASRRWRVAAVLAALPLLVSSPAWVHYPEWREASRWQEQFVAALERRLHASQLDREGIALAGIPVSQGQGPEAKFHLRGAHVALGWTLRDALYWRTGERIEIYGAAPVQVHAVDARFRMRVRANAEGMRVWPEGPVRLSGSDLVSEGHAGRALPFTAEVRGDTMLLRRLELPLWYWDGEDIALVDVDSTLP